MMRGVFFLLFVLPVLSQVPFGVINNWQLEPPRHRYVAVSNGRISMFAGGFDDYNQTHDDIDIFDGKNWILKKLSLPRAFLASTVNKDIFFFAGGLTGNLTENTTDFSDIVDAIIINDNSSVWRLSEPRAFLTASSHGNLSLFAGGAGISGDSDRIDILDISMMLWATAKLSHPRRGLTALTLGDQIIFLAGNFQGNLTSFVDIYETSALQWSNYTVDGLILDSPFGLVAGDSGYFSGSSGGIWKYNRTWSHMDGNFTGFSAGVGHRHLGFFVGNSAVTVLRDDTLTRVSVDVDKMIYGAVIDHGLVLTAGDRRISFIGCAGGSILVNGTECQICPPGKFSEMDRCTDCPMGTISTGNQTQCTACPAEMCALQGASVCGHCGPLPDYTGRLLGVIIPVVIVIYSGLVLSIIAECMKKDGIRSLSGSDVSKEDTPLLIARETS